MALRDRLFRHDLVLSGDVLVLRLRVEGPPNLFEADTEFWNLAREQEGRLRNEILLLLHERLGPEFDIRSMSFARGSLTLLLVVGTVYYAVSRYKNFVESVELFVSQLRQLVCKFFGAPFQWDVSVSAVWAPGPGLVESRTADQLSSTQGSQGTMLWYLILTHAAMLGVIIWLLLKKLSG